MNKLQEIIDKYIPSICQGSWHKEMIIEYAKICLEKAANEACLRCQGVTTLEEWKENNFTGTNGFEDIYIDIDKQSITNIELP